MYKIYTHAELLMEYSPTLGPRIQAPLPPCTHNVINSILNLSINVINKQLLNYWLGCYGQYAVVSRLTHVAAGVVKI